MSQRQRVVEQNGRNHSRSCGSAARGCMLALALTHCTGAAYLGAAPSDAGRSVQEPRAGQSGSGSGGTPADAVHAGSGGVFGSGDSGRPGSGSFDAGARSSLDATAPDSEEDAGSPGDSGKAVCVNQPSFESTPAGALVGIPSTQLPWGACFTLQDSVYSAPNWVNETTLVSVGGIGTPNILGPASAGSTYLYLDLSFGGKGQSTSAMLCDSLRAGASYAFAIDLMTREADNGMELQPGKLEIYASPDSCSLNDGVLWTSPALTPSWKTYCARFTPPRDSTYLTLRLPMIDGRSAIGVDNIRPEPGCVASP